MIYSFPQAILDPGAETTVTVALTDFFKPEKIVMTALMDVIRGHFKIKRSRLPLLDRDDVFAYSHIRKRRRGKKMWFERGKTIVMFPDRYPEKRRTVYRNESREYLPSSVEYVPVDPLSYIVLHDVVCDSQATMIADIPGGVPASCFGAESFGNALPLPTSSTSLSLLLKNEGDVQVRVRATIFGRGLVKS